MRALQSFMSVLKTAVVAVAVCLFLGTSVAIAAQPPMKTSAPIVNGGISVKNNPGIPVSVAIDSATAELPSDVVGGMVSLVIKSESDAIELSCMSVPVIEDIDLLGSPNCKNATGMTFAPDGKVTSPLKLSKGSTITVSGTGFKKANGMPVNGEDLVIEFT